MSDKRDAYCLQGRSSKRELRCCSCPCHCTVCLGPETPEFRRILHRGGWRLGFRELAPRLPQQRFQGGLGFTVGGSLGNRTGKR